jgi:hypothetical protein
VGTHRLLAEVDDDMELIKIRDERMKQIRESAEAGPGKHQQHATNQRAGELVEVPASALLRIVNVQDYVVALLRSADGGTRQGGGDDVPSQVPLQHFQA